MYDYKAQCVRVIDGDTIDCVVDLGFCFSAKMRLRLLGVDTPELNSKDVASRDRANTAKAHVIAKILGKEIIVETRKHDSFGRYLADVYYHDPVAMTNVCLNTELLRTRLADIYPRGKSNAVIVD